MCVIPIVRFLQFTFALTTIERYGLSLPGFPCGTRKSTRYLRVASSPLRLIDWVSTESMALASRRSDFQSFAAHGSASSSSAASDADLFIGMTTPFLARIIYRLRAWR